MIDAAAYTDLRNFIKRRIAGARYRVDGAYRDAQATKVVVLEDGTVRAQVSIIPGETIAVDRVELYNSDGLAWAHEDCNITLSPGQTGILYWFDFTIKEGASDV